jgi:hypothetical protein
MLALLSQHQQRSLDREENMSSDAEIQSKIFAFVDERKQAYIDRLAKAVS